MPFAMFCLHLFIVFVSVWLSVASTRRDGQCGKFMLIAGFASGGCILCVSLAEMVE